MSRARRFHASDAEIIAFLKTRRIAKGFTPEDLARLHPRRFDNGPHRTALHWARDRIKLLRRKGYIETYEHPGEDKRRVLHRVII